MRAPAIVAVVRTRTPPYSASSRIGVASSMATSNVTPVIDDGLGTDGAEGFSDRLGAVVAIAKQVQIAGWSEWIGDPGHKEHRSFQNEAVAMRGNAQPVEQTLERVARQQNLKIRPLGVPAIEEPCPNQGAN